jgi:beta-aspartyl-dipeptidase (metallo-type)
MLYLIKNADVYAPSHLGMRDLLIAQGKIVAINKKLDLPASLAMTIDAAGKKVTPGLIDQHIHITGAGGKDGFLSMTPEIKAQELIACGTTTAVGLLGTDGTARNIRALYGKVCALRQEGLSAYMYSGYYGSDTVTITESIQSDMVFVAPVLGFKIAISDIRSSYPTAIELVRKLREVRVGGLLSNKKGIMHVHLGDLPTQMDVLFELVQQYQFPIAHISPTHVGRSKSLFDQAIEFAKLGGSIDQGAPLAKMTFSTDGHAGLTKTDAKGNAIGFKKAPIDENLLQVQQLIRQGGLPAEQALQLVTTGPAANLGITNKGHIAVGVDADLCWFDQDWNLCDVFANGEPVMREQKILLQPAFD